MFSNKVKPNYINVAQRALTTISSFSMNSVSWTNQCYVGLDCFFIMDTPDVPYTLHKFITFD